MGGRVLLKAVLFDMDGVLVDTEPEYQKLDIMLAAELGIALTPREQSRYAGVSTLETWRDMQKRYGFAQDPAGLAQRVEATITGHYQSGALKAYPEAVALLKSCAHSGLRVAVATSSVLENAECVIRRLGLSEDVQAVASSCMTERSKPAPDIFLLAMRMLGVDGGDCLVIEDADSGVTAARAAGVRRVIGIRHPDRRQTLSGADLVVDTLAGVTVQSLRDLME
jgi:HAD superfamily hydrolase (TIGR01509 family)